MNSPVDKAAFESAQREGLTTFKSVFDEVLQTEGLNQFRLAEKLDCSQSYLSKIERGRRDLTRGLADKFSDHLGGTAQLWLEIFNETKTGTKTPVKFFLEKLGGLSSGSGDWGTSVRQLRGSEIKEFFERCRKGDITTVKDGETLECGIEFFDPSCVSMTSYDMRLGGYAFIRDEQGFWIWDEADSEIEIPPMTACMLMAKGHVQMPDWLEAEVNPPTTIALKPLMVATGPVIDPGWGGQLRVSAFNPTSEPILLSIDEPLLTLRFWVAEGGRLL